MATAPKKPPAKKPAKRKTAPKRAKVPGSGLKAAERYAWPDTVTAEDLGALINMSRRNVMELAAQNRLVRVDGRYKLLPSIHLYVEGLRDKAAGRVERDGGSTLATEKAGLTKAQRELEEMKLAKERRLVIPAEEVREGWTKFAVKVRSVLLGLPSKIRFAVPHMTAHDGVRVAEICRDALEDIAQDIEGGSAPPGATPEAEELRQDA